MKNRFVAWLLCLVMLLSVSAVAAAEVNPNAGLGYYPGTSTPGSIAIECSTMSVMDTEAYLNEYVAVKLFRDNDRYKDDVYVAVNGHNCVIKRGEWVKIKRKFALVLDQSEIQDSKAAQLMEAEQNRFVGQSRGI